MHRPASIPEQIYRREGLHFQAINFGLLLWKALYGSSKANVCGKISIKNDKNLMELKIFLFNLQEIIGRNL